MRKCQARVRREWDPSVVEGIAYLSLYDMEELKRRKLDLKAWAPEMGISVSHRGDGGVP